ncbi:MAG: ABC transporter permease [Pseudomonadota bacterium]
MTDAALSSASPAQAAPAQDVRSYWQTVGRRLRHDYTTLFFGGMVALIILSAVFAPVLAPTDPYEDSLLNRLKPIGFENYILGTDELGRDILSRLLYGGRISLAMGILPVLIATIVGGLLGIIAGFVGGNTNMIIMRTMDVFYAFPSILLAVAISGAMGGGIANGMISLTLIFIPALCRVAETATAQVRNLDYVEAARATGASSFSIIKEHILGNVLGPILIYASSLVSVSILIASGLSFLGLGVTPPEPDWGLMLNTLRQSIYINPMVCALPGVAILITSICFNLVSDGLRTAMDVRM